MKDHFIRTTLTRRDVFFEDAMQVAQQLTTRLGNMGRTTEADCEAEIERVGREELGLVVDSVEIDGAK